MTQPDIDPARAAVARLVEAFGAQLGAGGEADPTWGETQTRIDFIDPFLEALGWDVHNAARRPQHLREVAVEATIPAEDDRPIKKPDYELRLFGRKRLYVEAKHPGVRLDHNPRPARQARGPSAGTRPWPPRTPTPPPGRRSAACARLAGRGSWSGWAGCSACRPRRSRSRTRSRSEVPGDPRRRPR